MTALLGLLAIKGYQNRDKIAEMLKGAGATGDKPGSGTQPGLGGVRCRLVSGCSCALEHLGDFVAVLVALNREQPQKCCHAIAFVAIFNSPRLVAYGLSSSLHADGRFCVFERVRLAAVEIIQRLQAKARCAHSIQSKEIPLARRSH